MPPTAWMRVLRKRPTRKGGRLSVRNVSVDRPTPATLGALFFDAGFVCADFFAAGFFAAVFFRVVFFADFADRRVVVFFFIFRGFRLPAMVCQPAGTSQARPALNFSFDYASQRQKFLPNLGDDLNWNLDSE